MLRSALCRFRRELSNAYLVANFGFDTAETSPVKFARSRMYHSSSVHRRLADAPTQQVVPCNTHQCGKELFCVCRAVLMTRRVGVGVRYVCIGKLMRAISWFYRRGSKRDLQSLPACMNYLRLGSSRRALFGMNGMLAVACWECKHPQSRASILERI